MQVTAGGFSVTALGKGNEAVGGYLGAFNHQTATAGATQTGNAPVILYFNVFRRNQEAAFIQHRVIVVEQLRTQDHPPRMLAAGPERPEPFDHVTVAGFTGFAARIENCGDQRIRVVVIDISLRLLGQQTRDPGMDLQHAETPAGRAAARGDFFDHVEVGMEIHLPAAAAFRLDHPEKPGLFHFRDVFVGQTAQRIRLGGTGAQPRCKRTGGGNEGRGIGRGQGGGLCVHPSILGQVRGGGNA